MEKLIMNRSPAITGGPQSPVLASLPSAVALPVINFRAFHPQPRFAALRDFRRPNLLSYGLWKSAISSATYGASNGNGRPGKAPQQFEDGYKSGFLTVDPETSEASEGLIPDSLEDHETEKTSETPGKRRGTSWVAVPKSSSEKFGEDPYRLLENGQKVYLDELDVITLLEPPPYLRPLPSVYYNHGAFLWKKIGDIPEERRHRLLNLLLPKHITKLWELSKLRYESPESEVFLEAARGMLPRADFPEQDKPAVWDGRVTQVPWYYKPFSTFQKVFFVGKDEKPYGRVVTGGKLLSPISDRLAPLYFEVMQVDSVMATEEPCDLVLEYGDGQLHLRDSTPPGLAKPRRHLPPFNDKACDYLRAVGPGVMVGQAWVEGKNLDQIPRRLFGEFVMVQRCQ